MCLHTKKCITPPQSLCTFFSLITPNRIFLINFQNCCLIKGQTVNFFLPDLSIKFSIPTVRELDYPSLMRQVSTNNPLSWKGNIDYRKSALYYVTLGRAFRNCFPFETKLPCIYKYDDRENH